MNQTINKLKELLKENENNYQKLLDSLETEFYKIFDDSGKIKNFISKLENSENYTRENHWPHWPCQYLDNELKEFQDDTNMWLFLLDYLKNNYSIYYTSEHDYFELSCGPSIIIQDDNSVWCQNSDKIIIESKDYNSENELFELIENHMENSGFFPGVFRTDYYGHIIGPVNTSKGAE